MYVAIYFFILLKMTAEMDVSNKNVKKQIIGHFEQKQVFFWNPETNNLTSGHCILAETPVLYTVSL